jgi:hypothetical protein
MAIEGLSDNFSSVSPQVAIEGLSDNFSSVSPHIVQTYLPN